MVNQIPQGFAPPLSIVHYPFAYTDSCFPRGTEQLHLGKVELTTAESVLSNELERNLVTPEQLEAARKPLLAEVRREYLDWKRDNGYGGTETCQLSTESGGTIQSGAFLELIGSIISVHMFNFMLTKYKFYGIFRKQS